MASKFRSGLEGLTGFVAHDILHLPKRGLRQRYTKVFGRFALSGTMHTVADMGGGLSAQQSRALQFFCMQASGVVVEDSLQA